MAFIKIKKYSGVVLSSFNSNDEELLKECVLPIKISLISTKKNVETSH
ncbi:MAG: hypothetical protein PWP56_565 [Acetobacterium sp.]|jgi:hypothetical protein|nr:hypothetical protein [Acetobacterium sp. KB-1]MDK2941052.1 hypothetical protein [Acetobacterium sp.]